MRPCRAVKDGAPLDRISGLVLQGVPAGSPPREGVGAAGTALARGEAPPALPAQVALPSTATCPQQERPRCCHRDMWGETMILQGSAGVSWFKASFIIAKSAKPVQN